MKVLITSCGRLDLLKRTLRSLLYKQQYIFSGIVVHEDSPTLTKEQADELNRMQHEFQFELVLLGGVGQHKSIEKFLSEYKGEYYLHVEDDWEFDNSYDWVQASADILSNHKTERGEINAVKVLCRKDSPHKNKVFAGKVMTTCNKLINVNQLTTWLDNGIFWEGFSFNPGVTNVNILKSMIEFPKFEQELAEKLSNRGYFTFELEKGVYTHIGEGRSTHD